MPAHKAANFKSVKSCRTVEESGRPECEVRHPLLHSLTSNKLTHENPHGLLVQSNLH